MSFSSIEKKSMLRVKKKHHSAVLVKYWLIGIILLITHRSNFAQTVVAIDTVEAENGVLNGVQVESSISGFSGSGYVTGFDSGSDQLTVTVTVPEKAFYQIMIGYHSNDYKSQNISINGSSFSGVDFQPNDGFTFTSGGKHVLLPGENTITIQSSWGWTEFDNFIIYTTETNDYAQTTTELVDPKASIHTKSVYNFLYSQYGRRIISGQFDNYFNELVEITGKTPLYRVWDFQPYTEGYPYLWENNSHAFGIPQNLDITEKAIAWYNSTGKKGIVGFGWHWHSPSGGTVGTNTFYNEYTTFDIKEAIQENSPNYDLLIRDIDAIAVELKKLEAANIPVIFRPLHEAGGGWFWWSGNKDAQSAEACKKLYRIIFDRMTNYHDIHNLIWAWSTYEEEWYPGNDVVDIVGMDSYPGENNYTTQKNTFDQYFDLVDGKKIIAMTENGAIPDPDDCLDLDAPWSFFMSWGDMVASRNETSHLIDVFSNPRVITLENDTFPLIISATNKAICSPASVTLEAEANFGTVNWFTEKNEGSPVHSGGHFTTPVISETTTFYVEASYNSNPSEIARIPVTVKVSSLVKESVISGANEVCQGATNIQFSLPPDSLANSYNWELPAGATIMAGSNSNSILVDFSETAESGTIKAIGLNQCGAGFVNTLQLSVIPTPAAPFISEVDGILVSDNQNGNQWYFNGNLIDNALNDTLRPQQSGDYYSIINSSSCSSQKSNTITFALTHIDETKEVKSFSIYPNPIKRGNTILKITNRNFEKDARVAIYDPNGRIVQSCNLVDNTIRLEKEFATGIYVIKIIDKEQAYSQKLIVKQ
jgi:mannan endo-1,4-beta-mannosidase